MDVISTILACSLYVGDDDLVRAIAESTSESNPFFVLDAAIDLTQVDPPAAPKSRAEAIARARDIRAAGGRPVLGLLQLSAAWMAEFGRDIEDAFDPCVNVALGTAMLAAFESECASGARDDVTVPPLASRETRGLAAMRLHRACVLRKYESAIGEADFAAVTTLELRAQRLAPVVVTDAPIFLPAGAHVGGLDPIFASVAGFPRATAP